MQQDSRHGDQPEDREIAEEANEFHWPVRERDLLISALRWVAYAGLAFSVVVEYSLFMPASVSARMLSAISESVLDGEVTLLAKGVMLVALGALALVAFFSPPCERKCLDHLFCIWLVVYPLTYIVPGITMFWVGNVFEKLNSVSIVAWAPPVCLVVLFMVSALGFAMSRRWVVWTVLTCVVLTVAIALTPVPPPPPTSVPDGYASMEKPTTSDPFGVDITFTTEVVVGYSQPIAVVLLLIAMFHATRDQFISWWLRRRPAPTFPNIT